MRKLFFILVFLFSLSLQSATYAEVVLTDQEAQKLWNEFKVAKQSIQNSKQQISQSKLKLEKALSDLELQKRNLTVQKTQLEIANKSLAMLNEEHKKEISKRTRERNIAYAIAAACVIIAVRK